VTTFKRLTTYRNGQFGLWLSAPRKNVDTAADKDLLISPTSPNLSFVVNGVATLGRNAVVTVAFDRIAGFPAVLHQFSRRDGNTDKAYLPQWQSGELDVINKAGLPPRYTLTAAADRLTLRQLVQATYQVRFLVTTTPLE
jgi:hypothetical protein